MHWSCRISTFAACALVAFACGQSDAPAAAPEGAGDAGAGQDAAPDAAFGDSAKDQVASPDGHDADAIPEAYPDAVFDQQADTVVQEPPPETDIDLIPWQEGDTVGYGVARKDTDNPAGNNFFLAYAGYNISLDAAKVWATALYRAELRQRGVKHLWAVQGPDTASYSNFEIGNSKIVAAMLPLVDASTHFVLAVGHSSGSFVAHELLEQVQNGHDPSGITNNLIVYFNLDGGGGLSAAATQRLRRGYWVAAHSADGDTWSPNASDMQALGAANAASGGYWEYDASGSGCHAGASWCLHMTLINTLPHNPDGADGNADYSDFANRPVSTGYIGAKAVEAGL
jgi:hypothetical protein